MKFKPNYLIIPLIVLGVSALGGSFTSSGLESWYATLNLPSWTPPGSIIGIVWTVIYILTAVSALIVWNRVKRDERFNLIITLFLVNAVVNVGWSWIFFGANMIGWALADLILIELTVLALIILLWRRSLTASLLLLPYAAWVAFAGYLNYVIWTLN